VQPCRTGRFLSLDRAIFIESASILPDYAHLFSTETCVLDRHAEEQVFVVLVVGSKGLLMRQHQFCVIRARFRELWKLFSDGSDQFGLSLHAVRHCSSCYEIAGLFGALGGWNLNTITLLETGPYLTPTDSTIYDQTNTDPAGDGAIVRPDIVRNPSPAPPGSYFNVNAFQRTPVGAARIGNAGVGILEAPGTIAVSAGLSKVMAIREGLRMRFEATFTNVLNHTNYARLRT
jgi:hypothetical protein